MLLRRLTTALLCAVDPGFPPFQPESHQHPGEGDHTSGLSGAAWFIVVLAPQVTPTFHVLECSVWMIVYTAIIGVPAAAGLVGPWVPGQTDAS